ncbi:hypothetical protein FRC04_002284 [Tulasnella sp. 424]|nr:hypothetical protein FRC04_002284 [Tulasnella sp. 424]
MRLSDYFVLFFSASVLASALNGVSPNPNERSISSENTARHRSRRLTNGERLAMGLPPLKPKRLYYGDRVSSAPRSDVSALPVVSRTCNILVKTKAGSKLGYISPALYWSLYYGPLQGTQAGALEVTFSYSPSDPSHLDILTTNGPNRSFPYFGGVKMRNDDDYVTLSLGVGRNGYFALTGTIQIKDGPTPQARPYNSLDGGPFGSSQFLTQSAIWAYDPDTQRITSHWVNSDASESTNYIEYIEKRTPAKDLGTG